MDGVEDLAVDAGVMTEACQGLHVLGEAASPVADAGVHEVVSDACVGADAATDLVDVDVHALAHLGDLVDEADAGGEVGVGGVLGHFGGPATHDHDGLVVAHEGPVE
jgi:hypothetical protein